MNTSLNTTIALAAALVLAAWMWGLSGIVTGLFSTDTGDVQASSTETFDEGAQ